MYLVFDMLLWLMFCKAQACGCIGYEFSLNLYLSLVIGPMSVNINRCDVVTVEGDTFSWLINIEITDVYELYLGIGSFSLDPSAANVGDHGPGMSVSIPTFNS